MKVFIADTRDKIGSSPINYHWCDDGELLMFGQFQTNNGNPSEIAMCGIKTRKFTTHILVIDMEIDKPFLKELITKSIEEAMDCEIDRNGDYAVEIGWAMKFNINDIMDDLLEKAAAFEDGDKVACIGTTLRKVK